MLESTHTVPTWLSSWLGTPDCGSRSTHSLFMPRGRLASRVAFRRQLDRKRCGVLRPPLPTWLSDLRTRRISKLKARRADRGSVMPIHQKAHVVQTLILPKNRQVAATDHTRQRSGSSSSRHESWPHGDQQGRGSSAEQSEMGCACARGMSSWGF